MIHGPSHNLDLDRVLVLGLILVLVLVQEIRESLALNIPAIKEERKVAIDLLLVKKEEIDTEEEEEAKVEAGVETETDTIDNKFENI